MSIKKLFQWLNEKDFPYDENIEEENFELHCELINYYNQKRENDLASIKISPDFKTKFINELSRIQIDEKAKNYEPSFLLNFLTGKSFRYSIAFASLLVVSGILVMNTTNSQGNSYEITSAKFDRNMEKIAFDDDDLDEIEILAEIKKYPVDKDLFKRLEEYYLNNGNHEMAEKIHIRLETVSK